MLFHYLMGYVALKRTNSTPSPLHVRNTTSQMYPRPLESESLILLGLCNLCCKEPSRWFSYILNLTPAGLDLSKHNTRKKKKIQNDSNAFAHAMSSRSAIFICSFHESSLQISMPGTVIVTEYSRRIYQGIANICQDTSNRAYWTH